MKMLRKLDKSWLSKAAVYACIHHSGDPHGNEYEYIGLVRDALHILTASELGYAKRRYTSVPNVLGYSSLSSYEYMFILKSNPNSLPGWQLIGTPQPMTIDRQWTSFHSAMFFPTLLKIINRSLRVSPSWRETLAKAAILIGKSMSTKDVGQAFLHNMIVIEMLLTKQGDRYSDILPERIESFLGWVGYWQQEDYLEKIGKAYRLRCSIVHDGRFDYVTVEDLLFTDDMVLNLMNNIVRHIRLFHSKNDVLKFSERVRAEHILGVNAKVRPDTLMFMHRNYTPQDLAEII
jgi:hypothetical protein